MLKSFLNKVAGLQDCNFTKKRLIHRYFPVNIANFLRTPIFKNICERMLLYLPELSSEAQPVPPQTVKMESFVIIINV